MESKSSSYLTDLNFRNKTLSHSLKAPSHKLLYCTTSLVRQLQHTHSSRPPNLGATSPRHEYLALSITYLESTSDTGGIDNNNGATADCCWLFGIPSKS